MMLLGFLLIFISVGGSFCDEDDNGRYERNCYRRESTACDPSLLPAGYPQNGEELLKNCRDLQTFASCIAEVMKNCNEDSLKVEGIQNLVSFLRTSCQGDNPIFQVISNNLQCIERVGNPLDRHCVSSKLHQLREHNREVFFENFYAVLQSIQSNDLLQCLLTVMEVTCTGVKYGHHCGAEVRSAVEEVLVYFRVAEGKGKICTPEELDEIGYFYGIFEPIFVEEVALDNALKKRRVIGDIEDPDPNCFPRERRRCRTNFEKFPENADDLMELCRDQQEYLSCMVEVLDHCKAYNAMDFRDVISYLKATCQEDNPTFKAIASNLDCIGDNELICQVENKKSLVEEQELLLITEHGRDILTCVYMLKDMICLDAVLRPCGQGVADAAKDVASHMLYYSCDLEDLEKLEGFKEFYEPILLEELGLVDYFKRKRK